MSIEETIDKVADALLALIAKHGNTVRVIDAVAKEKRDRNE